MSAYVVTEVALRKCEFRPRVAIKLPVHQTILANKIEINIVNRRLLNDV